MQVCVNTSEFSNGTPARVNRATGVVELAPSFFTHTPDEQRFILLHEVGHYKLQTQSERRADRFAANNLYRQIGMRRTADAINMSLHDTLRNDIRRKDVFNFLAAKDRSNGNKIMDISINDMAYDDNTGEMVVADGFTNEDGFAYCNTVIADGGNISALELTDYVNFCNFYGLNPCPEAVVAFRETKRRDIDSISNMSEKRRTANDLKERAMHLLEQGRITQKEYSDMVAGIDDRSWAQKFLIDAPLETFKTLFSAPSRSGGSTSNASSMLPVALVLIAVAAIVAFIALKK